MKGTVPRDRDRETPTDKAMHVRTTEDAVRRVRAIGNAGGVSPFRSRYRLESVLRSECAGAPATWGPWRNAQGSQDVGDRI